MHVDMSGVVLAQVSSSSDLSGPAGWVVEIVAPWTAPSAQPDSIQTDAIRPRPAQPTGRPASSVASLTRTACVPLGSRTSVRQV